MNAGISENGSTMFALYPDPLRTRANALIQNLWLNVEGLVCARLDPAGGAEPDPDLRVVVSFLKGHARPDDFPEVLDVKLPSGEVRQLRIDCEETGMPQDSAYRGPHRQPA